MTILEAYFGEGYTAAVQSAALPQQPGSATQPQPEALRMQVS